LARQPGVGDFLIGLLAAMPERGCFVPRTRRIELYSARCGCAEI
jgi:hypothetical protein